MMGPVWVTKDGTTVPISDMGDRHLLNAIALVIRRCKEWASDEDEAPELLADSERDLDAEFEDDEGRDWQARLPEEYHDLVAEAVRRGLLSGEASSNPNVAAAEAAKPAQRK